MEFASPTFLNVPISLSIVIWCAVGGRQSLLGSTFGAILIAGMQGALSESETFLDTWTLVMGLVFVLVVLFLPQGLAGAGQRLMDALFAPRRAADDVARASSRSVATPPTP
jgi:urea transport system permease protein